MNDVLRDRIRGAVLGQAIGDALGAPTEGMTRAAIRAAHGRVTGFLSDDPAGTDDTEYAALTARILLTHGPGLTPEDVSAAWERTLTGQEGGFAGGGFSEMEAIHNLARGLRAPATGTDNHEQWSDGSAMRVAPIGAYCAGDPAEAARLAGIDAQVSHARDGIWCGQAVAAAVAAATVTDDWRAVVDAGLAALPADSWSARLAARAVAVATGPGDAEARYDELERRIPILHYPWADVAPEATALAFGVFAVVEGDYVEAVLGGVNIGRDADTIAAMAGAMAGALRGAGAIPAAWSSRITELRGSCIRATAGVRLTELADEIADAVAHREEQQA
ncbi:ADP-ribosylglycohydrolase family protein [Dactylosporangium sp. NPDC005572]|uniref:ADP-ribosylglycohydrolase family protein n=1 Tax=Dactylosporangium sp. NPDC005572 TaxID=3156889 RepID=UPI0033B314AD